MLRNNPEEIKRFINEGRSPLLPFEIETLRAELSQLGVEQRHLSRLPGEAMEQSSETWHDNAPADAINSQSRVLSERSVDGSRPTGCRNVGPHGWRAGHLHR